MIAREDVLAMAETEPTATATAAATATSTATAAGTVSWSFASRTAATPPAATSSTATMDVVPGPMIVVQRYEYTGRELASESSGYYFRYRVYGPALGQFFTRDPLRYVDGMGLYGGRFAERMGRDANGLVSAGEFSAIDNLILAKDYSGHCIRARCSGKDGAEEYEACIDECRSKHQECRARTIAEYMDKGWLATLPDCPCCLKKAAGGTSQNPDGALWTDPEPADQAYHPGAAECIRSQNNKGGAGQQCCYDAQGKLLTGSAGLAAGTPDKVAPEGPVDALRHYYADVGWFTECRAYFGDRWAVEQYLLVRPPNPGKGCK